MIDFKVKYASFSHLLLVQLFSVIWRSCRGNVFVKTVEIKDEMTDPNSGELVEKNVFICFFQGNQLEQRVKKICDGSVLTIDL